MRGVSPGCLEVSGLVLVAIGVALIFYATWAKGI